MTADDDGVIRARRVELVDEAGAVRLVVGALARAEGGEGFGVALLAEDGRARAWLALGPEGPALSFDQAGSTALHLGVDDATADALHEGAFIHLGDRTGRPVASCLVEADSSLTLLVDSPATA